MRFIAYSTDNLLYISPRYAFPEACVKQIFIRFGWSRYEELRWFSQQMKMMFKGRLKMISHRRCFLLHLNNRILHLNVAYCSSSESNCSVNIHFQEQDAVAIIIRYFYYQSSCPFFWGTGALKDWNWSFLLSKAQVTSAAQNKFYLAGLKRPADSMSTGYHHGQSYIYFG